MPRIEFTVASDLPPERILAAATDFSDRRPELWPNISRRFYNVHDKGENWCECTEGSDVAGGIWARERYEWSGNSIRGTVIESNVFKGGTWELLAEPDGTGGSRVTVINARTPKREGARLRADDDAERQEAPRRPPAQDARAHRAGTIRTDEGLGVRSQP